MPLYRYVKTVNRRAKKRTMVVSYLLMVSGMVLLGWTIWPIFSFASISGGLTKTISPVSGGTFSIHTLAGAVSAADYQDPNTWYPTSPQKKVTTIVNTYTLTIPELKISNALVTVAGDDLAVSLVHYGGTPLPGQFGNTVIFGHSTLPQFYNPNNYKSIFSLLPTLAPGDIFIIDFDHIQYTYRVEQMVIVEPTDLSPLEQKFDDSYVTLVTCVPPGTYWKRLNVKARLVRTS